LETGEADWVEFVPNDLTPLLAGNPKVAQRVQNPTGAVEMMRPNHAQPPFNNPAIRRAFMGAIDQTAFMQAFVGDERDMYYTPIGYFCPHTPMASDAGLQLFSGPRDYAKVREMLKAAGYANEKALLMVAGDYGTSKAMGDVMADTMHRVGINVDYVTPDFATMLQRRARKESVPEGGWSAYITGFAGVDHLNPATHIALRGNGDAPAAWPGWCISPDLERLRGDWFEAPDLASQQAICRQMQEVALRDVPYFPLGQVQWRTAWRTDLTGVLPGFATFWNVRRV
jgi:peptide/nickel transport system substrate-binding protein